ncbi:MAG: alpha/beta fold hydrolase [Alphaproteobacteria bacterium]
MIDSPPLPPEQPRILARGDGETIAYHKTEGDGPTVVFLCGLRSDMTGTKATALEAFCRERGQAFLRFDYQGHGQSSGDFTDGTIGRWAEDAIAVIDAATEGPLVLVGSSMGGWIMLLVAKARKARIAGLVGIAAAPDFTREMMASELTEDQRETLLRDGIVYLPSQYSDEPTPLTLAFIEDGNRQAVLDETIDLDCPVRLLQGMKDPDVPWEWVLRIADALASKDVEITLVKEGDHRLSEPGDIRRLVRAVKEVLALA